MYLYICDSFMSEDIKKLLKIIKALKTKHKKSKRKQELQNNSKTGC